MSIWRRLTAPAPTPATEPTDAQGKVRVALIALEQAGQYAASRSVGMDTKASILLVIAGIVTTSSFGGDGFFYDAAVVIALLSGGAALTSLWPRKVPSIHPETVTNQLTANSDSLYEFEYWLLAMQKAAALAREEHMEKRGKFLTTGFTLALVAMTSAAGSLFEVDDWIGSWLCSCLTTK